MTIRELYEFCEKQKLLDATIEVCNISVNGCFIGYKPLDEKNISYSVRDDKDTIIVLE